MSDDSDNVIAFTGRKRADGVPSSREEAKQMLDDYKAYHIDESLSLLLPLVFDRLEVLGFPEEQDFQGRALGVLVSETLKALMCYHHKLPHPLHRLTQIFEEQDDDFITMRDNIEMNVIVKKE